MNLSNLIKKLQTLEPRFGGCTVNSYNSLNLYEKGVEIKITLTELPEPVKNATASPGELRLEVGKFYEDRQGSVCEIVRKGGDLFVDQFDNLYHQDGTCCARKYIWDLVREVEG